MASNVFCLQDKEGYNRSDSKLKISNDYNPIVNYVGPSKIWLFMIGGSAAGIITPLARFFMPKVKKDIIVPVFIDSQCHSDITATSISDIARYEEFCRLCCIKSKISQPFLFIEDKTKDLLSLNRFNTIIDCISKNDEIFVAFSVHSDYNVTTALEITRLCSSKIDPKNIRYGIFLPYLTMYTNENVADVLKEITNQQRADSVKRNLAIIESKTDRCSTKFILGLSDKCIIKEANYQKNPFNIVQLVMSFAIVSSTSDSGGYMYYSTSETKDFLTPSDVIQDITFRELLIQQDFTQLAFSFLVYHKLLPRKLYNDNDLRDSIYSYLKIGTDSIQALGDITVHRNNRMLLRNNPNLNTIQLNRIFKCKSLFGVRSYSVNKMANELMQYMNCNMAFNSNMAAHETLCSIHRFTNEHYEDISKLYY